jgi:hypothetical protein
MIDTSKAIGRRTLRFTTPQQAVAEIQLLIAAERAGTLTKLGNWSLGTTLNHLAEFIDYGYNGFPPDLNPPWAIKFILKFAKGIILKRPLPAGYRIPGQADGTKATQPVDLDTGAARCLNSWNRLATTAPTLTHPIFGPLNHDDWIALHLRHTELHLSFYVPKTSTPPSL